MGAELRHLISYLPENQLFFRIFSYNATSLGWEFNSAEFVNYCNLVKRGAETHSACKHIDITSFDLFNLDKEIDLSVSGKILIEKNIDVAVKHNK